MRTAPCCTTRAAAAQANAPATILAAAPSSACPTPVTVWPCCWAAARPVLPCCWTGSWPWVTAAACSRPARSSGQRTTASTCSPTARWSASTVWASSSGASRFRPGPGHWSRASRSWCSAATRCRWSHRRSRQLPADS
jgi:hypothetical protein